MAEQKDAQQWLRQLGLLRGLPGAFSFKLDVTSYRNGLVDGENSLEVMFQSHKQVLVLFHQPQSAAGRRILVDGENMWLTLPSSRRILRISPSQRLLGEASNGDVININFADYTLQQQREFIENNERLIELTLVARNSNQSYQRVVYLIDPVNSLPRVSFHYTAADKLIKEIHYERYVKEQGQLRVERMRLVNPIFSDRYTVMTLGKFTPKNFPVGVFKKENLLNLVI
ncbi:outer membrane lipoprotein-sorting protein [Aeromonas hydrophila]|uniref:outer membrane lipoprotein-sorting protein n=1 Tax=Aeromonas hydrophila TaxID=644 RepID=UPI0018908FC4|nr:outer membrane lipoprotein-sorting protein [Aeromonas hydrophila]